MILNLYQAGVGYVHRNVEVACGNCGKIFLLKNGRMKYCSVECRGSAISKRAAEKHASKSPKIFLLTCVTCNKQFEHSGRYASERRKNCSVECKKEHKRVKWPPRECPGCHVKFVPAVGRGGAWRSQMYCTPSCRLSNRPESVRKIKIEPKPLSQPVLESRACKFCKCEFQAYRHQNNKYCSVRCSKSFGNKVRLRAKKNRQTGGLLFSIAACEICGWDRNIERAHILPAHKGWKLSKFNVILLCPNHHRAFDSGQLTTDELHKLGVGWLAA